LGIALDARYRAILFSIDDISISRESVRSADATRRGVLRKT